MTKRWRQLTVWLHVLTSVGWMAQAMALCVLVSVAYAAGDGPDRAAAMPMALMLDGRLLAPMADASAFTGIMLSAATPWGFFRNWWVLVKFVITVVQLFVGIFLLSPMLTESVTAGPTGVQILATALMASAIAFQCWLSVAKPWGRIRDRRPSPTGPAWVFVVTVAGGIADLALAMVIGHPLPLLSIALLAVGLAHRPRWLTNSRPAPRPAATADRGSSQIRG